MTTRISSLDDGYKDGDLSFFPDAIDTRDSLYEVRNNAETTLTHGLTFGGTSMIVDDASAFPPSGLVRLSTKGKTGAAPELVYYAERTSTILKGLIRGFAGSIQAVWPSGITFVSNAVMAETHNAVKDAILNVENYVGTKDNPEASSLNGRIKALEDKYLLPRPFWRAFPLEAPPGAIVRFQNFTEPNHVKFLWDFGDGSISTERSPVHRYLEEGIYSVKLNVINATGGQAATTKRNCIKISNKYKPAFFYFKLLSVSGNDYTYQFIDQSDMQIVQRLWVWDDGERTDVLDPDIHTATHTYHIDPAIHAVKDIVYKPSLILITSGNTFQRVFLSNDIVIEKA